jgi:hypothetical protein
VGEGDTTVSGPPPSRPTDPTPQLEGSLALTSTSGPSAEQLAGPDHRFVPGTLVAGRFRIVAAAGRGGMGEVYRAEDLRLRQPVALKFLPQSHASDHERLERLVQEVRLAREVAHPNVCRVYDFIETGGEPFVVMEYVDGESLASLLQRLGRLPQERTVALAHDIVRGLAAVHERGILHRDLKPENVMVDGRGRARLMDFGVASLSAEHRPEAVLMGTPAYVAPEQFYGGPPSSRTDVYALGVLLYELLSGRLPFGAATMEELIRRKADEEPPPLSGAVSGLDPALETLVMRCLDRDPGGRPASARAVAEALPGGDVLDIAIAAGDTPDREVVAEARDAGGLSRAASWRAFAVTIAALLAFALLLPATSLLGQLPDVRTPERLAARCRSILRATGWQPTNGEESSGFGTEWSRYHAIGQTDGSAQRWQAALRGFSPLIFYYRHASDDSPLTEKPVANASVMVDHAERLVALEAVPALQPSWSAHTSGREDWTPLFAFAGLDAASFVEVPSRPVPDGDLDRHTAWEGPFPGDRGLRVRVEVASRGGRLVSFHALRAAAVEQAETGAFQQRMTLGHRVQALLLMLPVVPAVWLALRHLRLGRVDRRGSLRLATGFFAAGLAARLLEGAPLLRLERGALVAPAFGHVLTVAAFSWLLYMAAEPYVRQRWPRPLVGWARLLGGRLSDPLVGRDLLLGVLTGAVTCLLLALIRLPLIAVLMPPLPPFMPDGPALASGARFLAQLIEHGMVAIAFGLVALVAAVLLRSVVRDERLAVAIALLLAIVPHAIYVVHQPLAFLVVHFLVFFPATVLVRRVGLLAFMVFYFSYTVLVGLAGSVSPYTWPGRQGLAVVGLLALLAAFGLYTSLGRRLAPLRSTVAG